MTINNWEKEQEELYFPWKDVDACMDNVIEPQEKGMTCPACGKELTWIRFISPQWTWEHLCGREGPLAICKDCHKQVAFRCELMN
ncbi:MAG: hypothetical protein IKN44_00090 [Bacteroidaceae bacterium]|nr:hypothetical protein [Bacteroidaceae bacterium]